MLSDLVDLVLPATCALCHRPGPALCRRCRGDVTACLHPSPRLSAPSPPPPGMPSCWVCGTASGALRAVVTAYKDEDRRDLAPQLVGWLAPALRTATGEDVTARRALRGRGLLVVPVPGSPRARRHRGDVPLLPLARGAARALVGRAVVAAGRVTTRPTHDPAPRKPARRDDGPRPSRRGRHGVGLRRRRRPRDDGRDARGGGPRTARGGRRPRGGHRDRRHHAASARREGTAVVFPLKGPTRGATFRS